METLGERIRAARLARGYSTGKAFAAAIGIAPERLSRYERSRIQPSSPVVTEIARVCGVTTDWLLTGKGEPPVGEQPPTGTDG